MNTWPFLKKYKKQTLSKHGRLYEYQIIILMNRAIFQRFLQQYSNWLKYWMQFYNDQCARKSLLLLQQIHLVPCESSNQEATSTQLLKSFQLTQACDTRFPLVKLIRKTISIVELTLFFDFLALCLCFKYSTPSIEAVFKQVEKLIYSAAFQDISK